MAALALLALPAWSQEPAPEEEVIIEQEAPQLPAGQVHRGERDVPALLVRIREPGVLEVKSGEDWKGTTLDGLAESLDAFAKEQDKVLAKDGKSAYEKTPGGTEVSRLYLALDVGPTVPWQHAQLVLQVAAQQKFRKLEVTDGKRTLLVDLPVDAGMHSTKKKVPDTRLQVHAVARAEQVEKWGDVEVNKPAEIRYKFGPEETASLPELTALIRSARKAAEESGSRAVGEVKSGNKVPFAMVFDILEMFDNAGIADVNIAVGGIPSEAVRKADRLPYPLKNYDVN
ncbi:MAG TPA: hypothetical protein VFY93_14650 [Planctomycetota bacterium]|nr:hypothetical protein [Planctomycetota bacterium]